MPSYIVTEPNTGKRLKLTGDVPPTEQELDKIFSEYNNNPTTQADPFEGQEVKPQVGIGENLFRTVGGAVRDTAQATTELIEDAGSLVGANFDIPDLAKVPEPTYTGGKFLRNIGGYLIPYVGLSKATKGIKAVTTPQKVAKTTALGSTAEQFAFSPDEERLSNFIQQYPSLQNPVTEYLQADPDDTTAEARFKMALEGTGLSLGIEGILKAAKGLKTNKVSNNQPIKTIDEKLPEQTEAQKVEPTLETTKSDIELQEPVTLKTEKKSNLVENIDTLSKPLDEVIVQPRKVESGFLGKHYQKVADEVIDYTKKRFGGYQPLGKLKDQDKYLTLRGMTSGKLAEVKELSKNIYDNFSKLNPLENANVYKYLTKKADINSIQSPLARQQAKELREGIDKVGENLVEAGILSKEVVNEGAGEYLPKVYLKYLNKQSRMGYTKKRKDLDEATKNFLGEIEDVALLGSKAIEEPMSDIVRYGFFKKISEDPNWTFQPGLVKFNNQNVSPVWLKGEQDRIAKEIRDGLRPKSDEKIIKEIDKSIDEANLNIDKADLKTFTKMPESKHYGKLKGAYVKKEIYDDIALAGQFSNPNSGFVQQIFGDSGYATEATKFWKMSKVALNPPTQIRNALSNVILLNLSGMKWRNIPTRLLQAMDDARKAGPYTQIAKKYGAINSTFSKQEMVEINKAYLKAKAKASGKFLDRTKYIAGSIADTASNAYQAIETIGKTAKIIDEMAKGVDEATAALKAQETLFDYSLVPPSVRYARNAPIGMPFVTFYYKVLPNLLETAIRYPERYAPYLAVPYGIHALIANYNDVSMEDFEKLKKALPEYLRDNNSALALPVKDEQGRWQFLDYSYFMPWGMFTGTVNNLKDQEFGELLKDTGALGGPVTSMVSALLTGVDAFTGRKIVNDYDPPAKQIADSMLYIYRLAAPTWLTDIGFAGRLKQAIDKDVNRFGEQATTIPQAMGRLVGFNIYPIDPELSRAENIKFMKQEIQGIKSRRTRVLKNPNLTNEERNNIAKKYAEQIQSRADQLIKYAEESEIPEQLK